MIPLEYLEKIIVVAPKDKTKEFAGRELQKYIESIAGRKIPVYAEENQAYQKKAFILEALGNSEEDEFRIESVPDEKIIRMTASNPRSLLYAVYYFLKKKLGAEWTSPGKRGEYLPEMKDVKFERFDIKEKAMLKYRGFYIDSLQHSINAKNISVFIDWMAKNYGNFLLVSVMFYEKIKEPLLKALKFRGMILEVGHHGFNFYVEPKTHFKEHPEWFSEIDAKREPGKYLKDIIFNSQLCVSNKEVIDYYAKSFSGYWNENPEIDILGVIPNDGFGWCECCECKKLEERHRECSLLKGESASGRYHHFVNEVVKKDVALESEKKIAFWAYADMILPSSVVSELPSNTILSIALYDRWYNFSLGAGDVPPGTANQAYVDILGEWREKFKGEINIYEYYEKYIWQSMPKWMPDIIRQDTRFFKEKNIQGLLSMLEEDFFVLYELNYMAQLAMSWSSGWTTESFLDEYAEKSFGQMSVEVKKEINKVISTMEPFAKFGPQYPRELSRRAENTCKDLEASFKTLSAKGLKTGMHENSVLKLEAWSKNMRLTQEHFVLNSLYYDLEEALERKEFKKALGILNAWTSAKKKFYKTFKELDGSGVCLSDDMWIIEDADWDNFLKDEEKLRKILTDNKYDKEMFKLLKSLKRITC